MLSVKSLINVGENCSWPLSRLSNDYFLPKLPIFPAVHRIYIGRIQKILSIAPEKYPFGIILLVRNHPSPFLVRRELQFPRNILVLLLYEEPVKRSCNSGTYSQAKARKQGRETNYEEEKR
jgi:hypothetical protein